MFTSDKDLRKAVPKKAAPVRPVRQAASNANPTVFAAVSDSFNSRTDSTSAGNDIVEHAKRQREARANQREVTAVALCVQSWWRGRHAGRKYYEALTQSIAGKLSDIEKISTLLEAKGSTFVMPPNICFDLVRQCLVLGVWSPCNVLRVLNKLCKYAVMPSVSELDAAKNVIVFQLQKDGHMRTLTSLYCLILRVLQSSAVKTTGIRTKSVSTKDAPSHAALSQCLQMLVGAHAPYKMKFSAELDSAFQAMRMALLGRCNILHHFRPYFATCGEHFLSKTNDGEQLISVSSNGGTSIRSACQDSNDGVFAACVFLVEASTQTAATVNDCVKMFIFHIFSVPMLTLLLSTEAMVAFSQGRLFAEMVRAMARPAEVSLPGRATDGPSAGRVISAGQWVLGNLAALSEPLLDRTTATKTESSAPLDADLLRTYLLTCTAWLSAYCLPELLCGRSGIIWQRQGANSIAVAVPCGLEEQILTLISPRVLSELSQRIMQPITCPSDNNTSTLEAQISEWEASFVIPADLKDITQALSSSAYVVTHATLKDHQEASTWFTAKWAKKITSSITSSLGFNSFGSSSSGSSGQAKKVEQVNSKLSASEARASSGVEEDTQLVSALCGLWELLLPSAACSPPESLPWKALSQLAFSGAVVQKLWCFLLHQQADMDAFASSFKTTWHNDPADRKGAKWRDSMRVLFCLVSVLRMVLIVLGDSELYDDGKPLPLHQIVRLVRCLKVMLFKTLQEDPTLLTEAAGKNAAGSWSADGKCGAKSGGQPDSTTSMELCASQAASQRRTLQNGVRAVSSVLSDLYSRWARRPFSSASLWEISEAAGRGVLTELQQRTPFGTILLRVMPWCVDFHERMKLFRSALDEERLHIQGSNDLLSGGPQRSRGVLVKVRKARILEDGMEAMSRVGANIKDRIVVKYINDFGEEEAGIDAGGLFKDFVTDLSGRIFDPSYGLFCTTASNLLYPNPSAAVLFDPHEMDTMFVFLGRVLGKALFENITLQPQFAHFFLAFMHGKYNFMNLINDLHTLDPELYKNLMFLKTYEGDIADLGLTFSITDTSMGGQKEVELIPGGGNMDVTSQNRHRYINLAAKYYLHDRLKRQAKAFFSGLYQVVHPDLLSMFCAPELQILISGSQSGLSVEDLKTHTRYAGGYVFLDRHITRFWAVFAELSTEDQALLLKFVTSCERPPSLGFASLQPPFTIQRVDCSDDQRLPTASTCFNILKLPTYSSSKVLKEKLLQSIRARAGFDLS